MFEQKKRRASGSPTGSLGFESVSISDTDASPIDSKDDRKLLRSEVVRQFSFIDDRFVGERVTVEEAFERVGGFGRFQLWSCVMNTLANMGAVFFLMAFAFLEKEPTFKCQMTPKSTEWTFGTEENSL